MADADPALAEQLFGNFQYEIYERGLAGERPKLPVSLLELEAHAREVMSAEAFGYVAGGAGSERTVQANRAAFDRLQIVPRMLRDVSSRELSTSILGTEIPGTVRRLFLRRYGPLAALAFFFSRFARSKPVLLEIHAAD